MAVMPTEHIAELPRRGFTLAQLSEAAGVPARTIRYYQSTGLLPKPGRLGKQALYPESHLELLRAIDRMQADGLRLSAIHEVLGANHTNGATGMVDLLGPEVAGAGWLATAQRTFTEGELAELLGEAYPTQVSELVKAGFLEVRTSSTGAAALWFTPSLPQLKGALALRNLGTDIAVSGEATKLLRKRIRRVCEELVALWISEAGRGYAGEATQAEFEAHLEEFRSVAWQSAAHVTAVEMERAIRHTDKIRSRIAGREAAREERE
jgi:DNA-binding transcriptional MerR regulator